MLLSQPIMAMRRITVNVRILFLIKTSGAFVLLIRF
jgi:hypothetical protein